jgi:hypothetical protein
MTSSHPNVTPQTAETWDAADGPVITIRPISEADLALEQEFVDGLSASTGYQRLMSARRPSLEELRRFGPQARDASLDIGIDRHLGAIDRAGCIC